MDSLFEKLEKTLEFKISAPLKNVLRGQKLNQERLLAKYDSSRLPRLEEYARGSLYLKRVVNVNDESEMKEFFGDFYDEPEKFEFTEGEKLQLQQMIEALSKYKKCCKVPVNGELVDDDENLEEAVSPTADSGETIKQKLMESRSMAKLSIDQKSLLQDVVVEVQESGAYFLCSFCQKKIKATMIGGHCQMSNFTRHFLKHTRDQEKNKKETERAQTPEMVVDTAEEGIDIDIQSKHDDDSQSSVQHSPIRRVEEDHRLSSNHEAAESSSSLLPLVHRQPKRPRLDDDVDLSSSSASSTVTAAWADTLPPRLGSGSLSRVKVDYFDENLTDGTEQYTQPQSVRNIVENLVGDTLFPQMYKPYDLRY